MIRKRVEKVSSREKIKTNVEKETGDRIRAYELDGVKVDEDLNGTIHMAIWLQRFLDLPVETIRESLDWK